MRSAAAIWQQQMEFELKQKEVVAELKSELSKKDEYIAKLEVFIKTLNGSL